MASIKRSLDDSDDTSRAAKWLRVSTHEPPGSASKSYSMQVSEFSRLKAEKHNPHPGGRKRRNFVSRSAKRDEPPPTSISSILNSEPPAIPDSRILCFRKEGWRRCFGDASQDQPWGDLHDPIASDAELEAYHSPDNEQDPWPDSPWLESVDSSAWLKAHDGIPGCRAAACGGYLIRRDTMSRKFHQEIAFGLPSIEKIGLCLFDRYGRLRQQFKQQGKKKGSGIWGDEMDRGDLLFIGDFDIEETHGGKGLESGLVSALLDRIRIKSTSFFALADALEIPVPAINQNGPLDLEMFAATRNSNFQFWRALGFRRIGSTMYFGLASDQAHPCHSLAAGEDYNPPSLLKTSLYLRMRHLFVALMIGDDEEALDELVAELDFPESDPRWDVRNVTGQTLLHLAVQWSRPNCVEWLMERCPRLIEMQSEEGDTALDAELERLREAREETTYSDFEGFLGYDDSDLVSMELLRGEPTDPDEILRLKFGCTCQQCIDGCVSPRMLQTLLYYANMIHRRLEEYLRLVRDVDTDHIDNVQFPSHIQTEFHPDKVMLNGANAVIDVFAKALKLNDIPHLDDMPGMCASADTETREAVRPVLRDDNKRSLVEGILTLIFEQAIVDDEWAGYPPHGRLDNELEDKLAGLPICPNDCDYKLVARFCGISEEFLPWGAILRRENRIEEEEPWYH